MEVCPSISIADTVYVKITYLETAKSSAHEIDEFYGPQKLDKEKQAKIYNRENTTTRNLIYLC